MSSHPLGGEIHELGLGNRIWGCLADIQWVLFLILKYVKELEGKIYLEAGKVNDICSSALLPVKR